MLLATMTDQTNVPLTAGEVLLFRLQLIDTNSLNFWISDFSLGKRVEHSGEMQIALNIEVRCFGVIDIMIIFSLSLWALRIYFELLQNWWGYIYIDWDVGWISLLNNSSAYSTIGGIVYTLPKYSVPVTSLRVKFKYRTRASETHFS